ncbi:MAG: hypothetical protein U9R72_10475 [Chloroflexota bacterium]|nr:hypothetical protein [Chloroflexota bacterium]
MDHYDTLFLRTLDDIEQRLYSQDSYELLGVSALLRKLLFDDFPLVDRVNRKHRLKIRFQVACEDYEQYVKDLEEIGVPEPMLYIAPEIDLSPRPPRMLTKDQFYGTVVFAIEGRRYAVNDIVTLLANVMGGVHAGEPRNDDEKAIFPVMNDDRYLSEFGSHPGPLYLLRSIGRVVLRALQPLRERVEEDSTGG